MHKRLSFLAGLGLAASVAQAQLLPPPARPDELMKAVTSEVIAILKQDLAAGERTDVARLVEEKILPLFDFQRMTSLAVALNWHRASPRQQGALVAEFRTLLVRTYSVSLSSYRETFAAAVRADGIDGLVKLLSDKNASALR